MSSEVDMLDRSWMRYEHRFLIVFFSLSCNGPVTLYVYVCMTYMYICMYNLCIISAEINLVKQRNS